LFSFSTYPIWLRHNCILREITQKMFVAHIYSQEIHKSIKMIRVDELKRIFKFPKEVEQWRITFEKNVLKKCCKLVISNTFRWKRHVIDYLKKCLWPAIGSRFKLMEVFTSYAITFFVNSIRSRALRIKEERSFK
jgi:hypothetical protein